MKIEEKNGRKRHKPYKLLQAADRGIKIAADTGYRTGYFMAKHPEVEALRKSLQKNRLAVLLAFAGVVFGIIAAANLISRRK